MNVFIIDSIHTKNNYKDKLFNLIERGEFENIKRFYREHPDLINKLYGPNHWSPLQYACRYGYLDIIRYFFDLKFCTKAYGNYSLMHMTFFNDEIGVLKYLFEKQQYKINDDQYEIPSIRLAIKYESWIVIEYLIQKGAYYMGQKGYLNNLKEVKVQKDGKEVIQYKDLQTGKNVKVNQYFDLRKLNSKEFGSQDNIKIISTFFKWVRFMPFLIDMELMKEDEKIQKQDPWYEYKSKNLERIFKYL